MKLCILLIVTLLTGCSTTGNIAEILSLELRDRHRKTDTIERAIQAEKIYTAKTRLLEIELERLRQLYDSYECKDK